MKLSFVILTYKTPHLARLCIQHIEQLALPFPYEIILVDNASGDNTVEMIHALFPNVQCIINKRNSGHPAGNNVGIRVATGEYIVLINPDVIFQNREDVERIIHYLDAHKDVAILGPRLFNTDGTIQNSCYRRYSLWTPIFRRTALGKLSAGRKDTQRHLMLDFDHQSTIEVEWLLGACVFVRRNALDTIGLMNERLFLYFGDYELCDRAHKKGWKVIYFHDTNAIFHYHKRQSAGGSSFLSQAFSYLTRVHIKDWLKYIRL